MIEPIDVPPHPKRARLFLVIGLVVLVAAGLGAWLGLRGGTAHAAGPLRLPTDGVCTAQVQIDVTADAKMRAIAATVVDDPQAKTVYTQTQWQAYQFYEQEFADEPELAAIGRPEALPASVVVVPLDGVDVHQLAARYRKQFPDAKQVKAVAEADLAPCPSQR